MTLTKWIIVKKTEIYNNHNNDNDDDNDEYDC